MEKVFRTNVDIVVNCPDMDSACNIMKAISDAADEVIKKFELCSRHIDDEYNSITVRSTDNKTIVASKED